MAPSRQSIEMILASTIEGHIGFKNQIPWRLYGDLKRFKDITMGFVVIMGRKTYESLPKPLEGRTMIVVSETLCETNPPNTATHFVNNIENALMTASLIPSEKVILIGGAKIYEIGLKICDKIHWTTVYKESDSGGNYDAKVNNFDFSQFTIFDKPIVVFEKNTHCQTVVSHTYSTYVRTTYNE